jgi:hypothetical protein
LPPHHFATCPLRPQAASKQQFHQGKTNSLPKHGDGHWITIGGHTCPNGKGEHCGGSPVYIEGGRITKGAPGLTGRSISNLREPAEHGTHRQQLNREREYEKAKWSKKARKEGIKPEHLHALASDIERHDAAHVNDRKRLIQRARQLFQHFGYGPQAITTNLRRAGERELPHLDQVAETLYAEHSEQFAGHERDLYNRVVDMLTEGNPKPMSMDRVYEQALEHLREHGPRATDSRHERESEPWDREPARPHHRHRDELADDDDFGSPWKSYLWCDPPSGHPHAWRRQRRIGRRKTVPDEELSEQDTEKILQALKSMRY